MKLIVWAVRLVLFFLLFGFAIKNDGMTQLAFFFGMTFELPLVYIILGAFAAGALIGVSATFGTLLRQRMERGRLRRLVDHYEVIEKAREREAVEVLPAPHA